MGTTIAVIGASGRLGGMVIKRLLGQDYSVIAIGRNSKHIPDYGLEAKIRIADCTDQLALSNALVGAEIVVSCVHAKFAENIFASLPQTCQFITLVGSTRKFTNFPDEYAKAVCRAEEVLSELPIPGTILHPTMIYGAQGENNVQRMGALIKKFRIMLLPNGGKALMQPVHVDDVAASFEAATKKRPDMTSIVISGEEPITYADFIRAIGKAMGCSVYILGAPLWLMYSLACLLRFVPGAPKITNDEVQRLIEDKAYPNSDMKNILGIKPRPLAKGLKETFVMIGQGER